jgi:hypothetical protein
MADIIGAMDNPAEKPARKRGEKTEKAVEEKTGQADEV